MSYSNKALILDRDGTINIDYGYVHKIENFELVPGTIPALKKLQQNFSLFIHTNQSGIGRGYYTEKEFHKINNHMLTIFETHGIKIKEVVFCPHSPEKNCNCRKPKHSLSQKLIEKYNIDIKNSFIIGDKTSDIKLAENLGMKSVLVQTGLAGKDKKYKVEPTYIVKNLLESLGVLL